MTTEDDFQRQLDACPEDWQTRLIFADWLQERNDPRAEGYRALGSLGFWSCSEYAVAIYRPQEETFWWRDDGELHMLPHTELPADWFDLLLSDWAGIRNKGFANRRHADNQAALAFAKLPANRRAELLATPPVTAAC